MGWRSRGLEHNCWEWRMTSSGNAALIPTFSSFSCFRRRRIRGKNDMFSGIPCRARALSVSMTRCLYSPGYVHHHATTVAVCRASDMRLLIGRGFESYLGTIAQWPWASYWHPCASVTKQYNLVLVKGRLPCDWEYRQNYGACVGGR